ncbi:5012_t:CDS:2, partial [Acaulospora morrowiae]
NKPNLIGNLINSPDLSTISNSVLSLPAMKPVNPKEQKIINLLMESDPSLQYSIDNTILAPQINTSKPFISEHDIIIKLAFQLSQYWTKAQKVVEVFKDIKNKSKGSVAQEPYFAIFTKRDRTFFRSFTKNENLKENHQKEYKSLENKFTDLAKLKFYEIAQLLEFEYNYFLKNNNKTVDYIELLELCKQLLYKSLSPLPETYNQIPIEMIVKHY